MSVFPYRQLHYRSANPSTMTRAFSIDRSESFTARPQNRLRQSAHVTKNSQRGSRHRLPPPSSSPEYRRICGKIGNSSRKARGGRARPSDGDDGHASRTCNRNPWKNTRRHDTSYRVNFLREEQRAVLFTDELAASRWSWLIRSVDYGLQAGRLRTDVAAIID